MCRKLFLSCRNLECFISYLSAPLYIETYPLARLQVRDDFLEIRNAVDFLHINLKDDVTLDEPSPVSRTVGPDIGYDDRFFVGRRHFSRDLFSRQPNPGDPLIYRGKHSRRKLQRRQTRGRSIMGKSSRRARLATGSTRGAFMLATLLRMKDCAWASLRASTLRRT